MIKPVQVESSAYIPTAEEVRSYVTEKGWLSGVACQEDGDSAIAPDTQVTRAELAQMGTVMGGLMER